MILKLLKTVTASLTLALFMQVLNASSISDAGALYNANNFTGALEKYEEILKTESNNPYLYYNIGNCYYRMGKNGLAILNYYKAFELLPRDSDIKHNLNLAMTPTGRTLVPAEVPAAVFSMFYWFSAKELSGLLYSGLLLSFGLLILIMWKDFLKNYPAVFRVFLFCCAFTVITGCWLAARKAFETKKGVVVTGLGEVRSGPGENFGASATAPEGYILEIINETSQWYEIQIPSEGVKGWIKKDDVLSV